MSKPVVVVIGVGGMGREIARRQGSGAQLVAADFDEELLASAADELTADGYDVTPVRVDVSERASVAHLARAAAALGPVTRVAHTAGLSPVQAPTAAVLAVDLLGVALVLEEFGAVVAAGGAGVVIASMAGHMAPLPPEVESALRSTPTDELLSLPFLRPDALSDPGAAYALAKRANHLRVQAAARAWGARGARINSVSPGVISTRMGRAELAGEHGSPMRSMIETSPAARPGTPNDIAEATSFLLSPSASFITGTDLLVDGGVVATRPHQAPAAFEQRGPGQRPAS
ncbi:MULTISPECIES: SDR family oxidoreductase [unclassified Streptomyces]|uniref:SDR family oxidoreductase n=1 Tax=unclassified Streptomyces TaxID=2593676 RepID=UPI00278C4F7A|nr:MULTISPECIES: SDR family oxidoreductase [unclassified Streptomyces]